MYSIMEKNKKGKRYPDIQGSSVKLKKKISVERWVV